jgi:hypothetical protein
LRDKPDPVDLVSRVSKPGRDGVAAEPGLEEARRKTAFAARPARVARIELNGLLNPSNPLLELSNTPGEQAG